MSKHVTISANEAADRLAIRELVEAYAHCADRRDAKGQMALFTPDTHFVVYMNAKDPKPSQELHSREALAPVFDDLNKYAATQHFVGQMHHLHADGRPSERGGLHHGASPHGRRWKATPDDRRAPLRRHVREDRRRVAVRRAPALRRLAGGARSVVTAKRLVTVGATGMVPTRFVPSIAETLGMGELTPVDRAPKGSPTWLPVAPAGAPWV
jgi:hypothetical protein